MTWVPLAASAMLSLVLVVALTWNRPPGLDQIIDVVRHAGVFLALGAPFLLDDSAAVTIASSPTTLFERRGLRLGIGIAAIIPVWIAILGYAAVRMDGGGLPIGALTLETGTMLVLGFLVAAGAIARGSAGGPSGSIALFLLLWALPWVPDRWSLLGDGPGASDWTAVHLRWGALLVLALVGTIAFTLDPARTSLRGRIRRA